MLQIVPENKKQAKDKIILDKIKNGEFQLLDSGGKIGKRAIFSKVINQKGEEIGHVLCTLCGKLLRHSNRKAGNLRNHFASAHRGLVGITRSHKNEKIANDIASGQLVLRNSTSTYKVWQIFAKIDNLNGEEFEGFVQCRICKRVYAYTPRSSGNLVRHDCYAEKFLQKKRGQESDGGGFVQTETPGLETQERNISEDTGNSLLEMMSKWVTNECQSYDITQDAGLRKVFTEFIALGAKYGTGIDIEKFMPNLTTISRNVDEIYKHCFQNVKTEIAAIKDKGFGITTDIWTDSCANRSYIAVTIHYLKNGSLMSLFLGMKSIYGERLTSHNVFEEITTILTDFECELSDKSIVVTSANDDIVTAFQNSRIPNFQCISLLLQNALKNAVEAVPEVAELVCSCVKLVNFLKESNMDHDFIISLQSYTPSRYSTIFHMLRSIENNWSDICETLENHNESQRVKVINISHLHAVTNTLHIFDEAIKALEKDSDATLHLVLVYLHRLKNSCDPNENEYTYFLREVLLSNLEEILRKNITIFHKMALFLYPPTNKLLLFSHQEKQCIEDECKRLCLGNAIKQEAKSINASMAKYNKLFADFAEPEANNGPNEIISQELRFYKNVRVKGSEEFDCFRWWELHKEVFPLLYKLSCCILAAPASITTVQHAFKMAGSFTTNEMMEFNCNQSEMEKVIFINLNEE